MHVGGCWVGGLECAIHNKYPPSRGGKKEIYIPYNSYAATSSNLKINDLLQPGFLNPEHIRYELHRVWVIEGDLKPGKSHKFAKRTLYFDEDSWIAVASDLFDQNNVLTHGQFGFIKNYYEHPACIQDFDVLSCS